GRSGETATCPWCCSRSATGVQDEPSCQFPWIRQNVPTEGLSHPLIDISTRPGCRSESAGGRGQAVCPAGVGVAVMEGAGGREHAGGGCGRVEGAGAGDIGGASGSVRADGDGEGGVGAVP